MSKLIGALNKLKANDTSVLGQPVIHEKPRASLDSHTVLRLTKLLIVISMGLIGLTLWHLYSGTAGNVEIRQKLQDLDAMILQQTQQTRDLAQQVDRNKASASAQLRQVKADMINTTQGLGSKIGQVSQMIDTKVRRVSVDAENLQTDLHDLESQQERLRQDIRELKRKLADIQPAVY